ncbi:MAG: hypothetical protein AAGE61_12585 [Pseudomonadota bacterium]
MMIVFRVAATLCARLSFLKHTALALAACLTLSPASAQQFELGPWYQGFTSNIGSIDITIDMDQLKGSETGAAALFFVPSFDDVACPRIAHPAFCHELDKRSERAKNDRSAFDIVILGVVYEGANDGFVVFRFADEDTVRALIIQRKSASAQAADVRVFHPDRGLDAQIVAEVRDHICETTQCTSDRLREIAADEDKALGLFGQRGTLRKFNLRKDERKTAHARLDGVNRSRTNMAPSDGTDPNWQGDGHGDAASDPSDLIYRLRNVPEGRSLVIRQRPDRNSPGVGNLPSSARGLRVLACTPEIDVGQFEQASDQGKLRLLATAWCEIASSPRGVPRGYVLGRYLAPQ